MKDSNVRWILARPRTPLLTLISQRKQIAIPSANGSKQQLLQQHTSLEISQGCTLASFGQKDSWRGASPKEFPE